MSQQENIKMELQMRESQMRESQMKPRNNVSINILNHFTSEKHKVVNEKLIKKNNVVIDSDFIFHNLCFNLENTNNVLLDYRYFKIFITPDKYELVFEYFYKLIKQVLENHDNFNIYIYMKTLSLRDIERYYTFICKISQIMKTDFEDKMEKCYIYNAPFVFSQLIKLISKFIDKKTQDKIQLVDE
jgi:hypothetical protein